MYPHDASRMTFESRNIGLFRHFGAIGAPKMDMDESGWNIDASFPDFDCLVIKLRLGIYVVVPRSQLKIRTGIFLFLVATSSFHILFIECFATSSPHQVFQNVLSTLSSARTKNLIFLHRGPRRPRRSLIARQSSEIPDNDCVVDVTKGLNMTKQNKYMKRFIRIQK